VALHSSYVCEQVGHGRVDLRTVQELLGHKTIQVTGRYAHLAPHHCLAAVQKLCDTEPVQNRASDSRTDTAASATREINPVCQSQAPRFVIVA